MTTSERIAKAHRAQSALDEFIAPMFDEIEAEWTARMVEVSTTELHPGNRADKLTALSHALKVTKLIRAGLAESIKDGEIARSEKLKADRITDLSDARQRQLRIAPY